MRRTSWIVVLLVFGFALSASAQEGALVERERARLRMHLSHVETVLRARDMPGFTEEQRAARARHLDVLHAYWVRGRFPLNDERPDAYLPVFIDAHDTACAVGYLIIEDGQEDLARRVQRDENLAYVVDMQTDGLAAWAEGAGFTVSELAMIQPSYCGPAFDAAPCGPADAGTGDGGGGGCSVRPARASVGPLALVGLALLLRRLRRR